MKLCEYTIMEIACCHYKNVEEMRLYHSRKVYFVFMFVCVSLYLQILQVQAILSIMYLPPKGHCRCRYKKHVKLLKVMKHPWLSKLIRSWEVSKWSRLGVGLWEVLGSSSNADKKHQNKNKNEYL